MGNDGGSIPTRRELVKNAARNPNTTEVKAALLESQTHAWTYCPLSNKPLSAPIVSDYAGILYNKDAVIEFLLPGADPASAIRRTEQEEVVAERIKSLRDIVEVKFETEKDETTKEERKVCPITSKELGASTKAVYLVPCGHTFSEAAIKEVAGSSCVTCNEPVESENIIPILPTGESEITKLAERIKVLKESGLTHSLKKAPGSKKRKKKGEDISSEAATSEVAKVSDRASNKTSIKNGLAHNGTTAAQTKITVPTPLEGIKNAATASLTAKVLEEQEERNKRRKLGLNDNLKSLFSNTDSNGVKPNGADFMTRGFSMSKKA